MRQYCKSSVHRCHTIPYVRTGGCTRRPKVAPYVLTGGRGFTGRPNTVKNNLRVEQFRAHRSHHTCPRVIKDDHRTIHAQGSYYTCQGSNNSCPSVAVAPFMPNGGQRCPPDLQYMPTVSNFYVFVILFCKSRESCLLIYLVKLNHLALYSLPQQRLTKVALIKNVPLEKLSEKSDFKIKSMILKGVILPSVFWLQKT